MKPRLLAAVIACTVVLAACGADKLAETAIEEASGGDVDVEIGDDGSFSASDGDGNRIDVDAGDGNVTIEGADGDRYTAGAELPDSFPDDTISFPLGFTVGQAQERSVEGVNAWVVIGTVDDNLSPVAEELNVTYGEPDSEFEQGSGGTSDHAIQLEWSDVEGYAMSWSLTTNADGDTVVTLSAREAQS